MATYPFTKQNPPKPHIYIRKHDDGCTYPVTLAEADCNCIKAFRVTPGGYRESTWQRSWKVARERAQAWCDDHDPRIVKVVADYIEMPILDGFQNFLDKKRTKVELSTLRNVSTLKTKIEAWLKQWNSNHKAADQLTFLHELTAYHIEKFVQSWDDNMKPRKIHSKECTRPRNGKCACEEVKEPMSKKNKQHQVQYLVQIFDYAIVNRWIPDTGETVPQGKFRISKANPANFVEISGKDPMAEDKWPFTDRLWDALLVAIDKRCETKADPTLALRTKTFFTLMNETGFAITDAMIARWDYLKKDGEGWYFDLERKKTAKAVQMHISDEMYAALKALPNYNPRYIFWEGHDYKAAGGDAKELSRQETRACGEFAQIFTEAVRLIPIETLQTDELLDANRDKYGDIVVPTPHCCRYTFADRFLRKGGKMEQLAIALGDTLEVVQKHYAKLTNARRKQVTEVVKLGHEETKKAKAAKKAPVFIQAPATDTGVVAQA